jgi:hypothetical protein
MAETVRGDVQEAQRDTRLLVAEKFSQSRDKANEAWTAAINYLNNLSSSVITPTIPSMNVAFPTIDAVIDPGMVAVRPTPPNAEDLVYKEFASPELGEMMSFPLGVYPGASIDQVRVAILARILRDAEQGSTGLDATVEAEIWSRALDRQRLKNEAAYKEAEQYFSSRGFDLPPGALSGRLLEIQAEILQGDTNINSDILIKQAELAQSNQQFVLKEGAAIANGIELNRIQLIAAYNKNVIDTFLANVEKYKTDVLAETNRIENLVKTYLAQVEAYKADASIRIADIDAQVKIIGAKVQIAVAASEIEIKEIEVEIEKARLLHALQVEVIKAGAQIAAQLAASAMGSVNASASMGFSGGASEQVGWNEGHSYDETKGDTPGPETKFIHNYEETGE